MNTQRQSGFTLLELLVTIIIAGVILGIGVPNLMEFQRNNAMAAASNDFVTSVLAARSEAVKRGVPVTLCASTAPLADPPACSPAAGTVGGFIVWVDENGNTDPGTGAPDLSDATDGNVAVDAGEVVLRRLEAPGGAINAFMDGGYIAYAPSGFARNVTGVNSPMSRLLFCDDRGRGLAAGGRSSAALVQVQMTGRAEVQREIAQVTNGIGVITAAGVTVNCP